MLSFTNSPKLKENNYYSDIYMEDDQNTCPFSTELYKNHLQRVFNDDQNSINSYNSSKIYTLDDEEKPSEEKEDSKRDTTILADQPKKQVKKPKRILNNSGNFVTGRWKPDEHKRFIEAILLYGNEWKKVENFVATRSSTQARSHAQKFFEKMKLANLIDINIDFEHKTSIKSLHQALKKMEESEYSKTVDVLNTLAFERKNSKGKSRSIKNKEKVLEKEKNIEKSCSGGGVEKKKSSKEKLIFNNVGGNQKMNFLLEKNEIFNLNTQENSVNIFDDGLKNGLLNNNFCRFNKTNNNNFLKKKKQRSNSNLNNTTDLNKNYLDIEPSEIEDLQSILFQLFDIDKKIEYDDFSEDEVEYREVFFYDKKKTTVDFKIDVELNNDDVFQFLN